MKLVVETDNKFIFSPSLDEVLSLPSHPANDARMQGILLVLEVLGDSRERKSLYHSWEKYKGIVGVKPNEEYEYCYPKQILRKLVEIITSACSNSGIISFQEQPEKEENLIFIMKTAWKEFNLNPITYPEWETKTVNFLKSLLDS